MQDITRRGFVSAAAIAAVTMPSLALAEEEKSFAATSSASALTGTADASAYIDNPGTEQTMTLDEINAVRKQIVDSITEDWVQEDGTVVPMVYVKVRELINTFSVGFGSGCKDGNWDQVMHNFSEEEAQAFLEMPWGKMFSAQDFAHESGRDEAECEKICYTMSLRGLLYRVNRGDRHYYHVCGYFHGIWEFGQLYHVFHRTDPSLTTFEEKAKDPAVVDLCNSHLAQWGDMSSSVTATAFFYTHPAGAETIKEGEELITYDDWRAQVARNTIIAVSPCQCRIRRHAQDAWIYGTDPCGHPIETCMSFGEFAEYYIENGIGRQITQEEATAIIEDAIYNHGMVMQSTYTKAMELFCFCHGDCCDIMSGYVALGEGIAQGTAAVKHSNISHYLLDHDVDGCIGCGICVDRCPVFAISLDEETGVSVTSATCVRCGQCALVCPTGCRKLTARPDVPYLPEDLVADYNLKACDRMTHGILG